jgi:hypothetical protein
VFDVRSAVALCERQRRTQVGLQGKFLLGTLRRVWQRLQQF